MLRIDHTAYSTHPMKIQKDSVVTLRFKVADATTQKLIEESSDPMVYLHGGYDNTFPKIEAALDGKEAGFQTTVDTRYCAGVAPGTTADAVERMRAAGIEVR